MNNINSKSISNQRHSIYILAVLLSSVIFLISCQKPIKSESHVLIKGIIENPVEDIIEFEIGDTTIRVPINKDNSFTTLIPLNEQSYGRMKYDDNYIKLYLTPNVEINLSFNTDAVRETLKFTGTGAMPINFSNAKFLKKELWKLEYWEKNENEFVDFVNERYSKDLRFLESFASDNGLPDMFVQNEKSTLTLARARFLMRYEYAHRRESKDPEFSVSDHFYNFQDEIDLNSDVLTTVGGDGMFRLYLMDLVRFHSKEQGNSKPNFVQAFNFVESKISNQKVLDIALHTIIVKALKYGIDDNDVELMRLFTQKCKNPEYIASVQNTYDELMKVMPGTLASKFSYADINGHMVALDDLKGKAVYMEFWATWCPPCRKQLPYFKKLEEKFKNDDVAFITVSVDKDKGAWEKLVIEKEMKGNHLISDEGFENSFCKDMQIKFIPRFILIDHDGYIIDAYAPKPSSDEIEPLLKEVLTII